MPFKAKRPSLDRRRSRIRRRCDGAPLRKTASTRHRYWQIGLGLLLLVGQSGGGQAFEALSGCFVADAVCPATPSVRSEANPGAIATEPGRAYPLLGGNRKDRASHVQIRVSGAEPPDRWVAVGCGHRVGACERAGGPPAADYVLAANWQPAFCELRRRPPECRAQTEEGFAASHLTLHGLWPEPQSKVYCGVDRSLRSSDETGRWSELPPVALSGATRTQHEVVMPGVRSQLERHEWLKHGTCAGAGPELYFTAALELLGQLNASPAQALIAGRVGRYLSASELRAAFEQGFGAGAGARVELVCEAGLITELRLHLRGVLGGGLRLADLLAAAPAAPGACTGGRIDPAGSAR
jgi:ribonuclease T2